MRSLIGTALVAALLCCGTSPATPTADVGDAGVTADASTDGPILVPGAWSFVMVADTHVTETDTPLPDLIPAIASENPAALLVAGDVVQTGKGTSPAKMKAQLAMFQQVMQPLYAKGIPVYPVRGNHEADATDSVTAWREGFANRPVPSNGPVGEEGLSYSVELNNALFVAADEYVTIHQVNQPWLDALFAKNKLPHVFVFGHEPAFKYFHTDNMDNVPDARNAFWTSLSNAGAKVYLCGHDHFRDLARVDDGDGKPENDLHQWIVGTGGGPFPPQPGGLTGSNAPFAPVSVSHSVENGYLLVTINDLDVTMTFKWRDCAAGGASCTYAAAGEVLHYRAAAR